MRLHDDFTIVPSNADSPGIAQDFEDVVGGRVADINISITKSLRAKYNDLNVTQVSNVSLLNFASLGHATATLDIEAENVFRARGWILPNSRDGQGSLGDMMSFGKYNYRWGSEDFILYTLRVGFIGLQYVLKEPGENESTTSHCAKTDALIAAAANSMIGDPTRFIYVYDRYWTRSKALYNEVAKASWGKVILDEKTKKQLATVSNTFFDSKEQYEKYGVPWRRGLIFHGPVGNGKTISIKGKLAVLQHINAVTQPAYQRGITAAMYRSLADTFHLALMHDLMQRDPAIPTLYVKSAPTTYDIGSVFRFARAYKPCMLVMEDVETIVTSRTRSYFFNEVDGLENNNGILMVASTNYLDKLDPGLSKRPSRFDRKYLFPRPNQHERELYAQYWRNKIAKRSDDIDFPEKLCPAIANITGDFSFAYMQEAFVATLLGIARGDDDGTDSGDQSADTANGQLDHDREPYPRHGGGHHDLDGYPFWRKFKDTVRSLREDMGTDDPSMNDENSKDLAEELQAMKVDLNPAATSLPPPLRPEEQPTSRLTERIRRPYGAPIVSASDREVEDPPIAPISPSSMQAPGRGRDMGFGFFEDAAQRMGATMLEEMSNAFGEFLGEH